MPELALPSRPVGGLWSRCHQGFERSGNPEADATRLAMVCGPSNGMRRLKSLRGEVKPNETAAVEIAAERGHCYRVFAAADDPLGNLTISARIDGRAVAEAEGGHVVLEAERPFCAVASGALVVGVSGERRGRYALEIWSLAPR